MILAKKLIKRKKKARYVVSGKTTKEEITQKKKLTIEQKFYWVRTGVAFLTGLLGVLLFNLKGWWMFLYLILLLLGWPFFQSFVIFRLPYKKDEWDWKKILKTGVGAHFFSFMLISTICFSLITLPEYRINVNNPADTYNLQHEGDYIYVADGNNGFLILEKTTSNNRKLIGSYEENDLVFIDIVIDRDIAILQTDFSNFYFLDISDKENPNVVEIIEINAKVWDFVIFNETLYVASSNGLGVLNYENINQIINQNFYTNQEFHTIFIDKQKLLLIDESGALKSTNLNSDFSDNLEDLGINFTDFVQKIRTYEDLMYIVTNTSKLYVYNIVNISQPLLIDNANFYNYTTDLLVVNENLIILAKGDLGVQFINMTGESNLANANVTKYNTIGYCFNIDIIDDYLLISDGPWGISLLDINNPIDVPELPTSRGKSISLGWVWIIASIIPLILLYKKRKHIIIRN